MNAETVASLIKKREDLRAASEEKSAREHAALTDEIDQLQEKLKRRPNHPDAEQMRAQVATLKAKRLALKDPAIAEHDAAVSTARKMARKIERDAAVEQLRKSSEELPDDALEAEERRLRADARAMGQRADVIAIELNRRRIYARAQKNAQGLSAEERAIQRAAFDEADRREAEAAAKAG